MGAGGGAGGDVLTFGCPDYPERLKEIYDPRAERYGVRGMRGC